VVPAGEPPPAPQRRMVVARCCVVCPCPHLLLVIPLPRRCSVVPRRGRQAGDIRSLKRGKPTEPGCLASA